MPTSAAPTARFIDRAHEQALVQRWQVRRCALARSELAAAYQPLVRRIARAFHRRCREQVPLGDLVQEGNIGLLTALDRFEAGLGNRFGTYAQWWIAATIRGSLRSAGHLARRRDPAETGPGEMADPGVPAPAALVPLDLALAPEAGGGTLMDRLSDEGEAVGAMLGTRQADQLRAHLGSLLDGLDATLRRIVVDRFCREEARPRAELAHELGMSLYEVRAGEGRALDMLRRAARARGLSQDDLRPA
jgi:RNA polymerase sigma factor (sigma-70 family)